MFTQLKIYGWAVVLACVFAMGMGAGWMLWRPKPKVIETYAPEVIQKDGSKILERRPDPHAKAAHVLPPGAVVERIEKITLTPRENLSLPPSPGVTVPRCPQMSVDLSLVRMPDGTRRVVASSPDGIVSGVDIPVEAARPEPKALKWSAGGSYNPASKTYGAWVARDVGPMVFGADLLQTRDQGRNGWAGLVRLGVRF